MPLPVHHFPRGRSRAGMTLIEILAVIAVIIVLFSLLMGLSGSASTRGDIARVRKDFAVIEGLLDEEKIKTGRYPEVGRLDGLIQSARARQEDPWGGRYAANYRPSANRMSYQLASTGPNGKPGKAFVDDDLNGTIDDASELGLDDDILSNARND
jgi:type II secretory pathway pseudopilin PulG